MISDTPIWAELRLNWSKSRDYLQPPVRQLSDPATCAERISSKIMRPGDMLGAIERCYHRCPAPSVVEWRSNNLLLQHAIQLQLLDVSRHTGQG